MDELLKVLFIIFAMFGFFVWERRYQRISDLIKTLKAIRRELRNDSYKISMRTEGGLTTLELSNDISRITRKSSGDTEVLECNLFFNQKEECGANKTVLSCNTKVAEHIYYLRRNELLGRVLHCHSGSTRNKKVECLMNDIVSEMKKCQLRCCPISNTIT